MKATYRVFFILISIFLYKSLQASQITINNLSNNDKQYYYFSRTIINNNKEWLLIKKSFKPSLIQKITPLSISIYSVKESDTIFSIAEKLHLNSDTLISFNSISNSLALKKDQKILVPNMDGVVIFPAMKTSTDRIARIYNIPETLLLYVNNIETGEVVPREEIFIPFARMRDEEKAYFLAKPFIYPLLGGHYTSSYGLRFHPVRKRWLFHGGVDIGTPASSKVFASSKGRVIFTGRAGGYGNLVVIKHKYGYTTWYGHLSKILVKKNQKVDQRDLVALSGSSGISTGPHLHFEIRRFNIRTNPMQVLSFNHIATIIE